MNTLCNCAGCDNGRINGVGDWSGFWGGVGDFFSSGIGSDLLKAGVTVGVTYGLSQLTSQTRSGGGGGTGNLTGGVTVNPAGSGYMPQAQSPQVAQQSAVSGATPEWLLPVLAIGALAVFLAARR